MNRVHIEGEKERGGGLVVGGKIKLFWGKGKARATQIEKLAKKREEGRDNRFQIFQGKSLKLGRRGSWHSAPVRNPVIISIRWKKKRRKRENLFPFFSGCPFREKVYINYKRPGAAPHVGEKNCLVLLGKKKRGVGGGGGRPKTNYHLGRKRETTNREKKPSQKGENSVIRSASQGRCRPESQIQGGGPREQRGTTRGGGGKEETKILASFQGEKIQRFFFCRRKK